MAPFVRQRTEKPEFNLYSPDQFHQFDPSIHSIWHAFGIRIKSRVYCIDQDTEKSNGQQLCNAVMANDP